jgi:hypothetical protein
MIDTTTAVATIASAATKAIAKAGHPGHDTHTVGERLTSLPCVATIRACYEAQLAKGSTQLAAAEHTGRILIASYCRTHNL